jgi:hypothetical protein
MNPLSVPPPAQYREGGWMARGNARQLQRNLSTGQVILWTKLVAFILIWLLGVSQAVAKNRECLYVNKEPSVQLQKIINNIENLNQQPIPYAQLIQKNGYFVRITSLNTVLTPDNNIKGNAYLGGKPLSF